MMSETQRIQYFDLLKLFAIFLVIVGHVVQYSLSTDRLDSWLYRTIYSFHMPLFMMISGYFAARSMNEPFFSLLLRKFKQLILPCIVWGLLIYGTYCVIGLAQENSMHRDLVFTLWENFWFLKSLFICIILAYSKKFFSNNILFIVVTILISQCVITMFMVQWMYPAFLIGMLLYEHQEFWKKNKRLILIISLALYIVLLCFWNQTAFTIPTIMSVIKHKTDWSLYMAIGMRLYRILIGLFGSMALITSFSYITNKQNGNRWSKLATLGELTLGVYILQSIIIEDCYANYLFLYFNADNLNPILFYFIIVPLVSIVILIVCLNIVKLINKIPIAKNLLLGK